MNYNFITPEFDLKCDRRAASLVSILRSRDRVYITDSPDEIKGIDSPIVILPFFTSDTKAAALLEALPEGSPVFGGHDGPAVREVINRRGLIYTNILNEETFCRENALITAEAAMSLIINAPDTPVTIACAPIATPTCKRAITSMMGKTMRSATSAARHVTSRTPKAAL